MSHKTTAENYDADLEVADAMLRELVDYSAMDGVHGQNAQDALNNEWVAGITISDWVDRAARRVGTQV